jgi:hypothetical protein
MNALGIFAALGGFLFSIWAFVKYILLMQTRLDATTYKTLYEVCKSEKKFLVQEEFVSEVKPPIVFIALCFFKNCPWFYINHSERLLTAGWHGKDTVTTITCFRWQYKKLKNYLTSQLKELHLTKIGVPVELLTPHYVDRIGALKKVTPPPLLSPKLWQDIEDEVAEVFNGTKDKTSALLYGPPGNNKSFFVKYLSTKYKVPIKLITFTPDFSNHDLMLMFSQITPNSIVLFEDFDNYFDNRKCILGSENHGIKFTFDIILNGLDGVYNTYEKVVFIMTVNDIEKVDYALKNRPSRFKYVRHFTNPDLELISKLLPLSWANAIHDKNFNLDQILRLKEFQEEGCDLFSALKKLDKEIDEKVLKLIAYQRYQYRMQNSIFGSPEDDWKYAIDSLKEYK